MSSSQPEGTARSGPAGEKPPSQSEATLSLPLSTAAHSGGDSSPPVSSTGDTLVPPADLLTGPASLPAAVATAAPGYEILGELGRGGMGVVYKARQVKLNRIIALKMILSGAHAGAHELARFRVEAEAIARLSHPNIVQVYEIGEHEGKPFFSLEFCGGGGLDRKLHGTPLPPREAAALVEALARAIQAAHAQQVIHRDLKPANVLLTEDGTPKITDFGLAKILDEAGQTQSGAVMGTPSYMAPEQATGRTAEAGPAADVYSLGAILYECLTGRPPFRAATATETVLQVIADEPVAPSRLAPACPRDLETICLKCLQKEPHRRYASAEALGDDLRRFLTGEPIAARPVGRLERAVKWARRRPAAAALLGVSGASILLLFVVVSAFLITLSQRNTALAEQTIKAEDESAQAHTARDRAERTLLASLLRPLGHKPGPLGPFELESLRELAGLPEGRVRLRFLEQALARPETAERLGRRAEMVARAVAQLDPEMRQRALRVVRPPLQDRTPDPRTREACVRIAVALHETDPDFACQAASVLREAMARTHDRLAFLSLVDLVKAVAGLLPPGEGRKLAGTAAAGLADQMSKPANAGVLPSLTDALTALTQHLGPKEAGTAAVQVVERLRLTNSADGLRSLAGALTTLAGRLEREPAREVATRLAGQMETKSPGDALAEALTALARRLDPGEARKLLGKVVLRIAARMGVTNHEGTLHSFAAAVTVLAAQLGKDEAAAVAVRLGELMGKSAYIPGQPAFASALAALAKRLDGVEGRRLTGAASLRVAGRMVAETFANSLGYLAAALKILAGQLGKEEAAAVVAPLLRQAGKATAPHVLASLAEAVGGLVDRLDVAEGTRAAATMAERLTETLAQTSDPLGLHSLAAALDPLLHRLPADRARALAGHAADRLAAVMVRDANTFRLRVLAEDLAALAGRLDATEVGKLAAGPGGWVIEQMSKTTQPALLLDLSVALAALADRLPPEQARRLAEVAVTRVAGQMAKTAAPGDLRQLGDGLKALAQLPGAVERQRLIGPAAAQVVEQMRRASYPASLPTLAFALKALARGLNPDQVHRLARTAAAHLAEEMSRTASPDVHLTSFGGAFRVLAELLDGKDAAEAARQVCGGMSLTVNPAALHSLADALGALAARLGSPELVTLLSDPACVGPAQTVVLAQLGRLYGRTFGDVWDLTDWLQKRSTA